MLGGKVKSVINNSQLVTAGNEYLSGYAKEVGAQTLELIPTVVDLDSYDAVNVEKSDMFTIVWIGSQEILLISCFLNLHLVLKVLAD